MVLEEDLERGHLGEEHPDRGLPVCTEIAGWKHASQETQGGWWSWSRVKTENQVA